MRIRRAFLVLLPLALASTASAVFAQNAPACRSTVSGDLQLHALTSKIFGNTRTIRVIVPPGYGAPENAAMKYPVLYMLDGQNLFDACLSGVSQAEWGVDETVYRLERELSEIVGSEAEVLLYTIRIRPAANVGGAHSPSA